MQVKVDGKMRSLVHYLQTTSQPFKLVIKPDNADDWKKPIGGGNNTSMAENYYLFFKPLPNWTSHNRIGRDYIKSCSKLNQPVERYVRQSGVLKVVP